LPPFPRRRVKKKGGNRRGGKKDLDRDCPACQDCAVCPHLPAAPTCAQVCGTCPFCFLRKAASILCGATDDFFFVQDVPCASDQDCMGTAQSYCVSHIKFRDDTTGGFDDGDGVGTPTPGRCMDVGDPCSA
jgi:hypothetical protein